MGVNHQPGQSGFGMDLSFFWPYIDTLHNFKCQILLFKEAFTNNFSDS